MVGFNAIKFSQRYSISFLLNTFVEVKTDLNELAKDPEAVLALMDGELIFSFGEESEMLVKEDEIITEDDNKTMEVKVEEKAKEKVEEKEVEVVSVEMEKQKLEIQLLLVVFLPDGGTVPEEQRVFLRKMIKATEIPGSQMKYFEIHQAEKLKEMKESWNPVRWMTFGLNAASQSDLVQDEIWKDGISCPAMQLVWNDISQKQVLWKLMQDYFKLKKK